MMVRSFTPAVGELFRLIPSDHGRPLSDIACTLDYEQLESDVRHALEHAQPVEKYVDRRGAEAHYLMRILPYRSVDNRPDGVSLTFIDVTDIARAEAHQRSLIAELNHRVKNMLAVVAALAEQTAARATSLEDFSQAFVGRVHGMARTHEILSRAEWVDVSLGGLLDAEMRTFVADAGRVALNGPDIPLPPRTTTTLGIAIHELATNAVKYGALSKPDGTVSLDWSIEQRADGPWLMMTWREAGGPPVAAPQRQGLGTQLIARGIEYELGGEARLEFRPEGLLATLSFRLEAGRHHPAEAGGEP
jgi:two-component system CheB/CheR fusion protein